MNNLDPDVAERPDELIVYGGAGKAARNWPAFEAIVRELQQLENDETLLVQSGKPVGVFRTHEYAPRVLIANSNLVGAWANWEQFPLRHGVSLESLSPAQREAALNLLRESLSVRGFDTARNVMKLNHVLGEITGNWAYFGEWVYFLCVFGEPSPNGPWGWQLDGHHLIINYFVLGDQVVMTPAFMGSEPVSATTGPDAGTKVLQDEQDKGLAFMRSLPPDQQKRATIETSKTANNALSQAFRDNLTLDYAGLRAADLSLVQRNQLLAVIEEYVGNMDDGHARVRMEDVRKHLDATYFAWVGSSGPDDVFYYRIHSPVVLIEFDHQTPVALPGPRVPGKIHVHTVVRTPNGNDYGKDLLRQHYEKHRNDPAHGHR